MESFAGRLARGFALGLLALTAAAAAAEQMDGADYVAAWGPAVGTTAPIVAGPDQSGTERDLDSLAAENGLLILFNRSADW
jgi:hypothetical protein